MILKKNSYQKENKEGNSSLGMSFASPFSNVTENKNRIEEEYKKSKKEIDKAYKDLEKERNNLQKEIDKEKNEVLRKLNETEVELIQKIADIDRVKKQIIADSKDTLIDVAVSLADKITQGYVKNHPDILQNLIEVSLEAMRLNPNERAKLTLHVNPEDEELTEHYAEDIRQRSKNQIEIRLHTNAEISLGSCFMENESGSVNYDFTSQLELFRQKLKGGN